MSNNQFILAHLQEGESCKEMVMNDVPLFTQHHYETIKGLIAENETLTHIGTRIYFRQSSIAKDKVPKDPTLPDGCTIDAGFQYDVTVMTRINRDLSLHLSACDIIEKIYNYIKPSILFH